MIRIDVQSNLKEFQQKLDSFARQQLPFATARALTTLAGMVRDGERAAMGSVFDRPTPFTINSVGVKPAKKTALTATVFVKDIAAAYLQPYETGGKNKLNSKALLLPVKGRVALNQYGNLPRRKIATLKARSDIYVGTVVTKKAGAMAGVWRRFVTEQPRPISDAGAKGGKGAGPKKVSHLELLIRFTDAHPAKQRLGYIDRAEKIVRANFNVVMKKALEEALATAKLK